ncbi:hypothetical protein GP486_003105 [Trichoglossum hirsutum]|uniref:Mid2 domain-containing protein n=1 Tax=Trichoglossum hirsutum TaxID=265104 RepID=A0A9P8RRH9_9PEZI|nr:hypothetical protein GP486_003105 [Trichoglossum hirsutum]
MFPFPKRASLLLLAALHFVPTEAVFGARKVGLYRYSAVQESLRACGRNTCTPPSGYSVSGGSLASTLYCAEQGQTLCAAEFSYGCCGTDYYCGTSTCYSKTTTSFSLTITAIATIDGVPVTTTQVILTYLMPKPPISTIPAVTKATQAPATDTTNMKNPAAAPAQSPSSGLPKSAVIGLVVGILACMVIVVSAACLIFRKARQNNSQHDEKNQSGRRKSRNLRTAQIQTSPQSHSDSSSGMSRQHRHQRQHSTITGTIDLSSRERSDSSGQENVSVRRPSDSSAPPPSRSRGNSQGNRPYPPVELHGTPVPQKPMASRNPSIAHADSRGFQINLGQLPNVAEDIPAADRGRWA